VRAAAVAMANGYLEIVDDDKHDYVNEMEIEEAKQKNGKKEADRQLSTDSDGYLKPSKSWGIFRKKDTPSRKHNTNRKSVFKMGTHRFKNLRHLFEANTQPKSASQTAASRSPQSPVFDVV
jgi:hypothetical protein